MFYTYMYNYYIMDKYVWYNVGKTIHESKKQCKFFVFRVHVLRLYLLIIQAIEKACLQ